MQNITAALAASIDPVSLMSRIAEQICLFTPKADGAAVSILTTDNEFVVVSAYGLVASLLGLALPTEGTFQGRAIATGQPQISHETASDPSLTTRVRDIGNRLNIHSLVVIPSGVQAISEGRSAANLTQQGPQLRNCTIRGGQYRLGR